MDRGILRQTLIGFVCKYPNVTHFDLEISSRWTHMGKSNRAATLPPGSILIIDCGLHEGWSTPTIPKFNGEDPLEVTSNEIAWIVNLMYVGVGIGSLVPFALMDSIGRKGTLLVTTIPKIASWIFIGLSTSVSLIYIGRILAGIGCGITYAVMPMYLGEISSKRTRGPLGTTT
jgi:MFS family permease